MASHAERTMSATEFKAKCLDVMDRLHSGELERVVVTKHGEPWATMGPPPAAVSEREPTPFERIHGCMKDDPLFPPDFDFDQPLFTPEDMATWDASLREKLRRIVAP